MAKKEMESGVKIKEEGMQLVENVLVDGNSQWDAERFIEQVWRDLEGAASRTQIRKVLMEAAPAYENARIKTYVPILLRQDVLQRLQDELGLNQETKMAKSKGVNDGVQ